MGGITRCGQSYGRTYRAAKTQGEYVADLALQVVQIQGQKNPQDGQEEGGRNNGQPVPGSVVQCVAADEGGMRFATWCAMSCVTSSAVICGF